MQGKSALCVAHQVMMDLAETCIEHMMLAMDDKTIEV
jgi:hypothetical protein